MKSSVNKIVNKLVALLMIAIMVALIANKAFFSHAHKLNNGSIITHAHPYDKSKDSQPFKSHHHTNAEFLFYQNLNLLFPIVFITIPLIVLDKTDKVSFKLRTEIKHNIVDINSHRGRAPPNFIPYI
ncbi:hypothetical protein [Oceanihabitans sp. IOP_32]|uniref:hypothetical protein n=1 Tax=Oceanihabitans sp. IOP_32 TaxID=2529032 RepID=UPI0018854EE6|nr:hypothetical protein [Oceanihabitans sp. IOP_32]